MLPTACKWAWSWLVLLEEIGGYVILYTCSK